MRSSYTAILLCLAAGISYAAPQGSIPGGIPVIDINNIPICCPGDILTDVCAFHNILKTCATSGPITRTIPELQPVPDLLNPQPKCTPNLKPCAISDPGKCCSQCCMTVENGAVCCDIDPPSDQ
ncbi:hypothetical protein FPQ18DRAFT_377488 [Pyronema domesticum]|uniref:Uncharacterized protein n=1 Tax=Pyronema omphalodes (strain CBS 100304) TaxID=1076935 RepID=U4KXU5_PYROM|nr:hypothetical protein FPQ18DRAFT_377488 [Pyronema domesticum]CCX06345.1 Protein of unknown function [Pyronema omphalodes CBS 100304]